jgi:hypothetical protein
MNKIDDGESAFPRPDWNGSWAGSYVCKGMSLRDWFATSVDKDEYGELIYRNASQAMKELIAGKCPDEPTLASERPAWQLLKLDWDLRVRAAIRYRMADAMLEARKVQP